MRKVLKLKTVKKNDLNKFKFNLRDWGLKCKTFWHSRKALFIFTFIRILPRQTRALKNIHQFLNQQSVTLFTFIRDLYNCLFLLIFPNHETETKTNFNLYFFSEKVVLKGRLNLKKYNNEIFLWQKIFFIFKVFQNCVSNLKWH